MALLLFWGALQRHPFGLVLAAVLVTCCAWSTGVSVPIALVLWVAISMMTLHAWCWMERWVLERRGYRRPTRLERERLTLIDAPATVEVLVSDAADPWLWRGMRTVVVSRGLLDLLEDRALRGLLTQSLWECWSVTLTSQLFTWLGVLPLAFTGLLSYWLLLLGRLLAIAVGWSLVLPLLLWPSGFARWVGGALGAAIVGVVSLVLIESGFIGIGLGLMLSWAVVAATRRLVGWEWRRSEAFADQSTVGFGLGLHLHEALETLAWMEPVTPSPWVRISGGSGASFSDRAERVWKAVNRE
jgi:hypothetical protein